MGRLLRIALVAGAVLFGLLLCALLYIAYAYMPPEDRSEQPEYLTTLHAAHLDRFADVGAFRLHYVKTGNGTPIILLPGGGAWIYDMRDLARSLANHHTVYAVDPPGDGYTTPLSANPDYGAIYTLAAIDASLLAFVNQMHLSNVAVIGNSWGGGYALYFAEMHPDKVSHFVSLDGTGLDLDDTGGSLMWQAAKMPLLGEAFFKLGSDKASTRYYLTALLKHRAVTDDMVTEIAIPYSFTPNLISQWTLERNLDWRVTERLLPKLTMPTLIIWGKQDGLLPAKLYLPRWKALKPSAKIVEIDHAGHLVHDDQPNQVATAIERFLDQ